MNRYWRGNITAANVDFIVQDNATWQDALQFYSWGQYVPGAFGGNYSPWSPGAGGPYAPVVTPGSYGFGGFTGTSGPTGLSGWNFTGQNFRLDIKGKRSDTTILLTLLSTANQIVVLDPINRILQMNVPEATLVAALTPGEYVYELMMFDNSAPPVRVPLCHGKFIFEHGISGG